MSLPSGEVSCAVVFSPLAAIFGEPDRMKQAYSSPALGEVLGLTEGLIEDEGERLGLTDGDSLALIDGLLEGEILGDLLGLILDEGDKLGD